MPLAASDAVEAASGCRGLAESQCHPPWHSSDTIIQVERPFCAAGRKPTLATESFPLQHAAALQ